MYTIEDMKVPSLNHRRFILRVSEPVYRISKGLSNGLVSVGLGLTHCIPNENIIKEISKTFFYISTALYSQCSRMYLGLWIHFIFPLVLYI